MIERWEHFGLRVSASQPEASRCKDRCKSSSRLEESPQVGRVRPGLNLAPFPVFHGQRALEFSSHPVSRSS